MAASDFTPERVKEVFEQYEAAHDELMEALKFLSNIKIGTETWVTTRQAAERSGVQLRTIQNWITSDKIRSKRVGRNFEVVLEDVIAKHSHRVAV